MPPVFVSGTRLTAARSGREPDVLFLARRHQDKLTETFLNGPADLVVEIVSPESQERDRVVKLAEYARGGVPEYWLIDPDRQEAIFYSLDSEGAYQARTADANGVYASVAVPPLWIRVSWLWENPLPPMRSVRATLGLN